MHPKQLKTISKFLSLVLRHNPGKIGLKLDAQGWADVDELLEKVSRKGPKVDFATLEEVVATNNKKRFTFNEDCTRIRANQGHSIKVDLGLDPVEPPEFLYHGTATRNLDSIRENGINRGSRHHVHLSVEKVTATDVGSRHGKPIILPIRAREMHEDGLRFFVSKNGVWLTDWIDPKYIDF